MKSTFDLVQQPWIQTVDKDGVSELSLRDVFLQSAKVQELADGSPMVNVAILRILLAIIHAAAWRDDDVDDKREKWKRWWQNRSLPLTEINSYLDKWHHRFDLFDAKHPFMQTGGLAMKESSSISRLAFEENNTTHLFAYPENPIWENPSPAQAARLLLATQSFALGFGKSSAATIDNKELIPPYTADAPLLRGLTIWLTGNNLLETLLLNLTPFDPEEYPEDTPSWELDAPADLRDKLVNKKRRTSPPRGVMDCCSWHSRLLRLIPEVDNGQVIVRSAYFTQGRSIDDETHFDPMKVYMASKKEGVIPLALSEHKAAWRDAASLFRTPASGNPCAAIQEIGLQVSLDIVNKNHLYRIYTMGVATQPGKAGKFMLWRHDRMPAPVSLLNDENGASRIQLAIEEADDMATQLYFRFKKVAQLFDAPNMEREDAKDPNPDAVAKIIEAFDPRRDFWPRLEAPFFAYLIGLSNDAEAVIEEWRDTLEQEAQDCFKASRDALGTSPRALRSAAVSGRFYAKSRRAALEAERKAIAKLQKSTKKEVK